MSELTFCSWSLPIADLGAPSPLPPLRRRPRPVVGVSWGDLPSDTADRFSYGHVSCMLPYSMQEAYSRNHRPQLQHAAVLENRMLRAVFLFDYGGRLWSLFHKPTQTESQAQSSAITFCNLGLRNAWFRGGVEWNVGAIGHSPLTCFTQVRCPVAGRTGQSCAAAVRVGAAPPGGCVNRCVSAGWISRTPTRGHANPIQPRHGRGQCQGSVRGTWKRWGHGRDMSLPRRAQTPCRACCARDRAIPVEG